jgi:hypothetical protein
MPKLIVNNDGVLGWVIIELSVAILSDIARIVLVMAKNLVFSY